MIVNGEGTLSSRIMIIGDYPSTEDERQQKMFAGGDGQLLMDMLAHVGLSRSTVWMTNVLKVKPPRGDMWALYTDKQHRQPGQYLLDAVEALKAEVDRVKPNVIIGLGPEVLKLLTGQWTLDKHRGSVMDTPVGKMIPTYHPRRVLRAYKDRAVTELDLGKAVKESGSPLIKTLRYNFTLNPTCQQAIEWLQKVKSGDTVAIDIETTGERVRCLGFARNETDALCIPFMSSGSAVTPGTTLLLSATGGHGSNTHWPLDEELLILKEINRVFEDHTIRKILQNFPFDSTILAKEFGFTIRGLWMDTMVAQHTCYSELSKGLDFLGSVYTNIPYWKSYDCSSDTSTWTYNCWDCVGTYQVAMALEKEMTSLGVWDFYEWHCQPVMMALTRVQNRGVVVDTELRETRATECRQQLDDTITGIKTLTGYDLNPNSPKQMKEFLYGTLGLPEQISHKTKKVTADADAIEKLAGRFPQHAPVLDLLISYREKVKLLSTFLTSKLNKHGRMETSYHATGTVTGRISSSKTIFGTGGNLQQIPRGTFRRMFPSPPHHSFIKVDLSQAEARMVAWLSTNHSLINDFLTPGFDIHRWAASIVFDKPLSSITKGERQDAKGSVHGSNYKIGARMVAKLNRLTVPVAKERLDRLVGAQPALPVWWQVVEDKLYATRKITTAFGRLRVFFNRIDQGTIRSAVAFEPQSIIGDLINRAIALAEYESPPWLNPVMQVHDEIDFYCEESREGEAKVLIQKWVEHPIVVDSVDEPLVIPMDMSVGLNWSDRVDINKYLKGERYEESI